MFSNLGRQFLSKQLAPKSNSISAKIFYGLHYNQKSTMPYNAQDFFQVVYEVEKYHHFLPWCSNSITHKRSGFSYFETELFVNFKVYQDSYLSKVSSEVNQNNYKIVSLSNNISAFKSLKSTWNIQPINENKCQIDYDIDFEFKNYLYQTVAQMFLDNVIKTINSSFEKRVQELTRQKYFETNKLEIFKKMNNEQQQKNILKSKEQTITNDFTTSQNVKDKIDSVVLDQKSSKEEIVKQQQQIEQITTSNQKTTIITTDSTTKQKQHEFDFRTEIEDHIKELVRLNIAREEEAQVFQKAILKSPEQKELIVNAYKFFIINKGLINMNDDQANWKFLSVLRSATLYK